MFKRVLTATGAPDACEPALITALEIAKQNQGKLFILHVMEATYRHECGPQESVTDFKTGEAVAPTHEYKRFNRPTLSVGTFCVPAARTKVLLMNRLMARMIGVCSGRSTSQNKITRV